ncbi:MAG: hypothetical protein WDN10_00145 [bacterium]
MIDPELAERLSGLEAKIDAAYASTEKTRAYLWWSGVIAVVLFVLPLIALLFAIPSFISTYPAGLETIQ